MESNIRYVSPESFLGLKNKLIEGPQENTGQSANDALLALFWRVLMKAAVATGQTTLPEKNSCPASPVDGRPDFYSGLQSSYASNLVIISNFTMPVIQLALLSITLRDVVQRIRAQAAKINPSFVEDTFNLMREIVDCTKLKHTYDLLVSLFAQEMEQLLEHGEFAKFAAFCCH